MNIPKNSKKVRHLLEGDVLRATKAVVVHEAQPSKFNPPYWYLTVKYPGKDAQQVYWKPDTTVAVEPSGEPIL